MTAVGYVISTLLGKVFLHEQVSPERWLGVALIFAGVAMVGSTSEKTNQGTGSNQMKWALLSVVVAATVLSDLLQSYQMKRAGEQPAGARGLLQLLPRIARNRYLILSIVCLAFSFFAFMALVQTEPLSFAVPKRPPRASLSKRFWRNYS